MTTIGHNRPPIVTAEELAAATADLDQRSEALIASAGRARVENQAHAGKAADLIKMITAHVKALEDVREAHKRPILEAGKVVDAHFKARTAPLDAAKAAVKGMVSAWQAAERAKAAAEAKAKLDAARAAEERARAAGVLSTTPVAEPEPEPQQVVRGATGAGIVTTKRWVHEVTDAAAVPRQYLTVDDAAIKAAVKAGVRDIPGVRIYQDETVTVR